jgi:hypothetical protein
MTDSILMTAKKLYAVRVEYQAYVLAESEADAEDFAREITNTEDFPEISVVEATGNELAWSGDCCIYHNGGGDIRLNEVLATNATND